MYWRVVKQTEHRSIIRDVFDKDVTLQLLPHALAEELIEAHNKIVKELNTQGSMADECTRSFSKTQGT